MLSFVIDRTGGCSIGHDSQ